MSDITSVDELVKWVNRKAGQTYINGQYFIAKPSLPYYHHALLRLRAAWAVLTGRAMAVQFMEDRVK